MDAGGALTERAGQSKSFQGMEHGAWKLINPPHASCSEGSSPLSCVSRQTLGFLQRWGRHWAVICLRRRRSGRRFPPSSPLPLQLRIWGDFGRLLCSRTCGKGTRQTPVLGLCKGRGLPLIHHSLIRCRDRGIISGSGLVLLCKTVMEMAEGRGCPGGAAEEHEWGRIYLGCGGSSQLQTANSTLGS